MLDFAGDHHWLGTSNMQRNYAMVFPGQGSQTIGMLGDLADEYLEIREVFGEASLVLGYDLWHLVQHGPGEQLNSTEFTQPALLAASIALWKVWQAHGNSVDPLVLAGHSLGEYAALVCAASLDFKDAIRLVAARGRLMQEACSDGAMVAIVGLDDDSVKKICEEASTLGVLEIANYNTVGQVVLAGELVAARRAEDLAKARGAKIAKILPVSVPSHCCLMKPAAQELAKLLGDVKINKPKIPVIQNVDVAMHSDGKGIRDALVEQLCSPVRWVDTVRLIISQGVQSILECGPGKVLTNLNKRIDGTIAVDFIGNKEHLDSYLRKQ